MKKVYQTIVDKGNGNCQQATIASLFELKLEEVPHFIENMNDETKLDKERHAIIWMWENGYPNCGYITTNTITDLTKITYFDGGLGGYFIATVYSQTFNDGTTHSVIVDKDLKVVHDPNPNEKALNLKPKDIIGLYTMNKDFYIKDEFLIIENNG